MHLSESLTSAYRVLEESIVTYRGEAVGTVASHDHRAPAENYADCFVRDFVPIALVYLLDNKPDIVKNFLKLTLNIRDSQEELEGHQFIPRVMPASFKVIRHDDGREELRADFGDNAIGRVAPVDSMMWWVLLLWTYEKVTRDSSLRESDQVQRGIRAILGICLRDRFEVFPTLLVPDGSFMIDRRMGVYGHPLEIQALFYACLNTGLAMLSPSEENTALIAQCRKRRQLLVDYVRYYYWLDVERLNEIHRYETELFGVENANALNIYPDSIPEWTPDWLPEDAGYMVGNLGPGRMDFRFFAFGNLLSSIFGLSTMEQSRQLMHLYEKRWYDLVGMMPVKICYPAVERRDWQLLTGSDPKNVPWSYHNGGNWPCLLWAFVGAAVKTGREDLAHKAMKVAAHRLGKDHWPEYYDGKNGRLIGRRANFNQTWSAAALILGQKFLDDGNLKRLGFFF